MKKSLFFATAWLLALPLLSQAQDSLLTYSEVIQVEGSTKEQLFVKARQWFNDAWKNSKEVLQITDKETGELSGKGIITSYFDNRGVGISTKVPVDYQVTVSIFVKDGRYKYEFTEFRAFKSNSGLDALGPLTSSKTCPIKFAFASQKKSDALYENIKTHLGERVEEIVSTLKQAMTASKSKLDF